MSAEFKIEEYTRYNYIYKDKCSIRNGYYCIICNTTLRQYAVTISVKCNGNATVALV